MLLTQLLLVRTAPACADAAAAVLSVPWGSLLVQLLLPFSVLSGFMRATACSTQPPQQQGGSMWVQRACHCAIWVSHAEGPLL